MIKTTHTIMESPQIKEFPLLAMLHRTKEHAETIVLFSSEHEGTIVSSQTLDIGKHLVNWESCFDKFHWKILPSGSNVILTVQ